MLAVLFFLDRHSRDLGGTLMFQVDQVTFRYGSVVALNNVSLDIQEGRRSALLCANGSGK